MSVFFQTFKISHTDTPKKNATHFSINAIDKDFHFTSEPSESVSVIQIAGKLLYKQTFKNTNLDK